MTRTASEVAISGLGCRLADASEGKWWMVVVFNEFVSIAWGRDGLVGESTCRQFPTREAARRSALQRAQRKLRAGYATTSPMGPVLITESAVLRLAAGTSAPAQLMSELLGDAVPEASQVGLPTGDVDRQLKGFEAFVDDLRGHFIAFILSAQQPVPPVGAAGAR